MIHNTLLTRGREKQIMTKLTWDGVSKDSVHCSHEQERGEKDDSNVAPFHTNKLAACTHFLLNVMQPKYFQSNLILTLSLKKRIRSWREKFAPSYNSFFRVSQITIWPQLGSREIPHVSHRSTKDQYCPWHNQHQAALTVWNHCGLSPPWHDSKTSRLARSSRKHAKPFLLDHCCSEHNQAFLSSLLWKPSQWGATDSEQPARWVRTQSYSRSPNLTSNSIRSKSYPATSWVAPRVNPK